MRITLSDWWIDFDLSFMKTNFHFIVFKICHQNIMEFHQILIHNLYNIHILWIIVNIFRNISLLNAITLTFSNYIANFRNVRPSYNCIHTINSTNFSSQFMQCSEMFWKLKELLEIAFANFQALRTTSSLKKLCQSCFITKQFQFEKTLKILIQGVWK